MWGQYSSGWGCVSVLIRHEPSGCLKTWKTVDCLSKCWGFWRKTQLLAVNCADILSRFARQRCAFFHPAAVVKFGSFKVISVDSQQPLGARWSSLRQQPCGSDVPVSRRLYCNARGITSLIVEFQHRRVSCSESHNTRTVSLVLTTYVLVMVSSKTSAD